MVPLITADYNLEGGVHFNSLKIEVLIKWIVSTSAEGRKEKWSISSRFLSI